MLKQKNKVVLALFVAPVRGQQPVQNPPPKLPATQVVITTKKVDLRPTVS